MKTTHCCLFNLGTFLLLLALLASTTTPAFAGGSGEGVCIANGGTWVGPNGAGTCIYAAGDIISVVNCGEGYIYYVHYFFDVETSSECVVVPPPEDTTKFTDDENGGTTTLNLGGEKNGSATFPPGTCPQKCTISSSLPNNAANDLPADALATMYVRVVNEDGTPGDGSYTVCFDNPDLEALIIYAI